MLEVKRKPFSHGPTAVAPARSSVPGQATDHRNSSPVHAVAKPAREPRDFQTKLPVITGECHFKGSMSIDGLLSGQVGVNSCVSLKQRTSPVFTSIAELNGEFNFRDMVRINGHIAGSVHSKTGTIIVDTEAIVDASVDVAVAVISGTVTGDVIARERVELGPASRIYGNIWTRSLVIKDGAIFEGVCRMIEEETQAV
jgi:cytoskeletal protein CcmA (bactofilin family)